MADQVATTLRKALGKLTSQKELLDRQIAAIETALGVLGRSQQRDGARGGPRRMSAAARRAVGKRMRAYWAKRRAAVAKGGAKASK